MLNYVTEGLPMEERLLALATQGQSYGPMFDEKLTVAAWKTKPTWALVSTQDQMLAPAMEATMAKRMDAVTVSVDSCHMVIQQLPNEVASLIDQAARNALKNHPNE
jgi:pimeloyl-ACP methyl ester carboxylesterase